MRRRQWTRACTHSSSVVAMEWSCGAGHWTKCHVCASVLASLQRHGQSTLGATVVQEVEKSVSNQKVASSIPCRSVLEQDTEPLFAPDVQCAISVNVKCVYIVSRTYVSRFG